MSKQFEYKGEIYWVTIEPAIHDTTKQTGFIAYVSDKMPGSLLYGSAVKDHEGKTIFFGDEFSALTNANAIKQSLIDSKS